MEVWGEKAFKVFPCSIVYKSIAHAALAYQRAPSALKQLPLPVALRKAWTFQRMRWPVTTTQTEICSNQPGGEITLSLFHQKTSSCSKIRQNCCNLDKWNVKYVGGDQLSIIIKKTKQISVSVKGQYPDFPLLIKKWTLRFNVKIWCIRIPSAGRVSCLVLTGTTCYPCWLALLQASLSLKSTTADHFLTVGQISRFLSSLPLTHSK